MTTPSVGARDGGAFEIDPRLFQCRVGLQDPRILLAGAPEILPGLFQAGFGRRELCHRHVEIRFRGLDLAVRERAGILLLDAAQADGVLLRLLAAGLRRADVGFGGGNPGFRSADRFAGRVEAGLGPGDSQVVLRRVDAEQEVAGASRC